ncbi:putative oxidase protein [Botrytis fragariae]|uniref:Putative oxidase protein n=1 Tax=Botrytis fragariae TaxID=1964551 RepID=A0A8H6AKC9_9HELO|nr:putative oxidase protein [Botrytis fragariae]KAF5868903.1 putative oxidase protein [Botrytis fragariae]
MVSNITFLAFIALSILPLQIIAFPAKVFEASAMNSKIASLAKAAYEERRAKRSSPGFNAAAQIINVSGEHAFVPPGPKDMRGPCPGLNALANHGFIPHNGFATISQIINANEEVFGMGADLAIFLTVYGLVMDGNPLSLNPGWSIGASPTQGQNILDNLFGLLGAPQGLIGSHNKYEGDTSPTRGDLFVYGNAWVLQMSHFQELFNLQPDKDTANYDIGIMSQLRQITFERSVRTNPYFFYGPFVGMAVSNAAQSFIFRFMANHTAEHPEGILDQFNLKSFFGVTGEIGNFEKKDGWERIPPGWGRRAIGDEYGILSLTEDIIYFTSEYPNTLTVGGNTGTVNSFTGVDFSDLTGGVYNLESLFEGNNLACFLLQNAQLTAPDFLKNVFSDITEPLGILSSTTQGILGSIGGCPQLMDPDQSKFQFSSFPGSGATL